MSKCRWIMLAASFALLVVSVGLLGCEGGATASRSDAEAPASAPLPVGAYSTDAVTPGDQAPNRGSVLYSRQPDLATMRGMRAEANSLALADAPEFDFQSVLQSGSGGGLAQYRFTSGALRGVPAAPMGGIDVRTGAVAREDDVVPLPDSVACAPTDELWIIVQPEFASGPKAGEDVPGTGALMTQLAPDAEPVPVPLEHTSVTGSVTGFVANMQVKQRFHNPYESKIEAMYVFPLPQNAGVNGFVMTIGDRQIRGIIRKRAEAEQIYTAARAQGHVASLLTQERANIFTQRVANIEPGKRIDVDITYFNTLSYSDGWYEFVFPMVVGPRFNPSSVGSDGIGHVPLGAGGASGQKTEVPYLAPNQRSGHDISLELAIEAGVAIEEVRSGSHQIELREDSGSQVLVRLSQEDSIPNRDFVLRYRVAGEWIKPGMIVQPDADGQGGHIALLLTPPASLDEIPRSPMELVFVLDCSGSMNGVPLDQAKAAVGRALDRLRPQDSFQIIRFSNNSSQLGNQPIQATEANVARGKRYLAGLSSGGGTMMIEGIRAALEFQHDPERLRFVAFLTDGYIGNESEILGAVTDKLGDSRIFSFGVGSSPNRMLMDRMARVGRGAVAYVAHNQPAEPVMDLFLDRVEHAALTNISLSFGALNVTEVYPRRMPDLFVGRPVVAIARYQGVFDESAVSGVTIRGRAGGAPTEIPVTAAVGLEDAGVTGLDVVWARLKIRDLVSQSVTANDASEQRELGEMVESVALHHGLLSAFTAFVAVDSSRITDGDHGTTVAVPVPVPEGVRYETTIGAGG